MPTTSVVIPAYNGIQYLTANLPQVARLGVDEIVIVDDASTDSSADFISNTYPQVKLMRHLKNIGFTQSVNDGFAKATGEIVFLLNQDVNPSANLVKKVLPHFKDPKVFAVTFNEGQHSYAVTQWQSGLLQFTSGPKSDTPHSSAWASGGSAAFRHSQWNDLGGFDPIFSPGYYEDLDLGLTAHEKGLKIIWDPESQVEHARETSFKKEFAPKKLQRIKDRNYLIMQWKHLDPNIRSAHFSAVAKRLIKSPGFAIPLLQAISLWISQKYQ